MKTIDHRILIPSPPDRVWEVVSDISRNPDWQIDCREVIFLTSKRSGPGLRWRYSDEKRREYVYEVSAWYAGLGYEYYFVDGPSFKDARGRIRLQEIPEGTIVQWTFSFEAGGLFSGVRDSAIDRLIQDSLRQLYQMLKTSPKALAEHQAKSLMRDAPDVEARFAYQPRHPSAGHDGDVATSTQNRPSPSSWEREPAPFPVPADSTPVEPPVTHEDTKPNPVSDSPRVIMDDAVMIPNDLASEPEFLNALEDLSRFEPPPTADATQPRSVSTGESFAPTATDTAPVKPSQETSAEPDLSLSSPVPSMNRHIEVADAIEPGAGLPSMLTVSDPVEAATPPSEATEREPGDLPTPGPLPSIGDTRSIWEIFNVSRPSEIDDAPSGSDEQAVKAVPLSDEIDTPITPIAAVPMLSDIPFERTHLAAGSRGLRQTIRRKMVRIRRPG